MANFLETTAFHSADEVFDTRVQCDPTIEFCATQDMFTNVDWVPITPYIMVFVVYLVDLLYYIFFYALRMHGRNIRVGTYAATNAVDMISLATMIILIVMFGLPLLAWPFHWLGYEELDFAMAWYMVNFLSDGAALIFLTLFIIHLSVAIAAGQGEAEYCSAVNGNALS